MQDKMECLIQNLIPNFNCVESPINQGVITFAGIAIIITFIVIFTLIKRTKKELEDKDGNNTTN